MSVWSSADPPLQFTCSVQYMCALYIIQFEIQYNARNRLHRTDRHTIIYRDAVGADKMYRTIHTVLAECVLYMYTYLMHRRLFVWAAWALT